MDQGINYQDDRRGYAWRRVLAIFFIVIFVGVLGVYSYFSLHKEVAPPSQGGSVVVASSSIASKAPTSTTMVVTSTPPESVTTSTATVANNYGMAVGETLLGLSPQNLDKELDEMSALGIGWLRFDINWDHVQPDNSSTFNWYGIDQLVAAANARHIKLLPIIDYSPPWARNPACAWAERCSPASDTVFGVFVQAAVKRYAPQGISDWEIWNEPNIANSWEDAASTSAYVQLLKVAYTTIKKIEPSSTVITGGLAPSANDWRDIAPVTFLSQIYQYGGKGYFDAVADHPYTFPALPSAPGANAWAQMSGIGASSSLRSVMIANGDANKKIWITEFGAPTNGSASGTYGTEAQQVQAVTAAFTLYKQYNWVGPFFWYSFIDLGTSTNTNENFFGIIRHDGSEKPAYDVLKNIISENL